jgi:hypothetical protein
VYPSRFAVSGCALHSRQKLRRARAAGQRGSTNGYFAILHHRFIFCAIKISRNSGRACIQTSEPQFRSNGLSDCSSVIGLSSAGDRQPDRDSLSLHMGFESSGNPQRWPWKALNKSPWNAKGVFCSQGAHLAACARPPRLPTLCLKSPREYGAVKNGQGGRPADAAVVEQVRALAKQGVSYSESRIMV